MPLCLTSLENEKKSEKKRWSCRSLFILEQNNFQTPEGTTFICINNRGQDYTPWDHAATVALRKETHSVSERNFSEKGVNQFQNHSNGRFVKMLDKHPRLNKSKVNITSKAAQQGRSQSSRTVSEKSQTTDCKCTRAQRP